MKKLIQSNFKTTASLTVKYILLHIAGNGIRILLKRKVESMSLHGMLLAVCLLILGMNAQAQFPVIAGTNTSVRTTQTSGNHIISLPSGIESGDLILIFWADGTETGTDPSLPGGYILLDSYETESSYFAIWYRIADGTEGATVSTTNSFGERSAHITYRIQKGTYTGVPIFERANGSSSSPNPPTLSPSWGSQNYLWIASAHANESSDVSSYPTNYGDELMVRTSGVTSSDDEHAQMATAHQFFETDGQNPGSFSFNQTVTWAAYTVAILPDLFNSPTNKLFMRNTAEGQSGTGANVTALSETQGSCTSITTDSYSGTDLTTERYAFTIDVDNLTESIASDIFLNEYR